MFQGCTLPGANEILNQFMEFPHALPLSDPSISAPPLQYPAVVHLFSESYLFHCLLE